MGMEILNMKTENCEIQNLLYIMAWIISCVPRAHYYYRERGSLSLLAVLIIGNSRSWGKH